MAQPKIISEAEARKTNEKYLWRTIKLLFTILIVGIILWTNFYLNYQNEIRHYRHKIALFGETKQQIANLKNQCAILEKKNKQLQAQAGKPLPFSKFPLKSFQVWGAVILTKDGFCYNVPENFKMDILVYMYDNGTFDINMWSGITKDLEPKKMDATDRQCVKYGQTYHLDQQDSYYIYKDPNGVWRKYGFTSGMTSDAGGDD